MGGAVILVLAAIALGVVALLRGRMSLAEFAGFATVAVGLVVYAVVPDSALLVLNALLLGILVGLLFLGYVRREDWLVTFATVLLFIFIVVKYFGWAMSLLNRSVAFLAAGVLLLVIGWLMERSRRYLIDKMEPDGEASHAVP